MNINLALLVAGIIFTFIGCMHFLRFFLKIEVIIAGKTIPYWISIIVFFISLLLSYWMYVLISWNVHTNLHH